VAFYCTALGFEDVARLRFEDADTRQLLALPEGILAAAYLRRDGWMLELLHFPEPGVIDGEAPRPMNRTGLTHLSFVVEDLDTAISAVESSGGRVLGESRLEAAVFVLDPDGTRIELLANEFDPVAYSKMTH
jgi:catechol 2,3-dioxygenase-like lactoylglutathione lyase family enzyme